MSSIRRAFSAYSAKPFLFMWGSFVYLFMLLVFTLALLGFVLIYFMLASVLSYSITFELTVEALPNLVAVAVVALLFIYVLGALNAALVNAYNNALDGVKTSLIDFYYYGLTKAPMMFSVVLMREFLSLLIIGPVVAIYFYFLSDVTYMDILLYLYALFVLFVLHMAFTPALVSAALGATPFDSFRNALLTMKTRFLKLFGMFIVFGFVLVLNFIPLIQIFTIFLLYPVVYSALIILVTEKGGVTVQTKGRR